MRVDESTSQQEKGWVLLIKKNRQAKLPEGVCTKRGEDEGGVFSSELEVIRRCDPRLTRPVELGDLPPLARVVEHVEEFAFGH